MSRASNGDGSEQATLGDIDGAHVPHPERRTHLKPCNCEQCRTSDRRWRCEECGNHVTIGNATVFDEIVEYGHQKGADGADRPRCSYRSDKTDARESDGGMTND